MGAIEYTTLWEKVTHDSGGAPNQNVVSRFRWRETQVSCTRPLCMIAIVLFILPLLMARYRWVLFTTLIGLILFNLKAFWVIGKVDWSVTPSKSYTSLALLPSSLKKIKVCLFRFGMLLVFFIINMGTQKTYRVLFF